MPGFRDGPRPGWGHGDFNGPGRIILCALLVLLLFAIVATAIYAVMRYVNGSRVNLPLSNRNTPINDSAEATLRMRLATGDISEEDFRSRINALRTSQQIVS